MKYLIYLAVATPLVLGWLLWASDTTPPQAPLISPTGLNAIAAEAPAVAPTPTGKHFADNGDKVAGGSSNKKS